MGSALSACATHSEYSTTTDAERFPKLTESTSGCASEIANGATISLTPAGKCSSREYQRGQALLRCEFNRRQHVGFVVACPGHTNATAHERREAKVTVDVLARSGRSRQ